MVLKARVERDPQELTQTDLINRIITARPARIVPIISNTFRINQIFCAESNMEDLFSLGSSLDENKRTIEQQLTQEWAKKIHYPMSDTWDLSRVAHFHQIESGHSEIAKKDYIDFLKSYLLDMSYGEPADRELVDELTPDVLTLTFSEIVRKLKYPRFPAAVEDPLALLARLEFPIYITTSYFDFLERALRANNKVPHTETIHWNNLRPARAPETAREPEEAGELYAPSVAEPVVYHLFGAEEDPRSLVMSEDDFLKFLIAAISDNSKSHPVVPLRLQQALAQSYLLLLGYQLRDWDFRILFRFLLNYRPASTDVTGIFIQVQPKSDSPSLLDYLSKYFGIERFDISWKTSERFIADLWQAWKGERS